MVRPTANGILALFGVAVTTQGSGAPNRLGAAAAAGDGSAPPCHALADPQEPAATTATATCAATTSSAPFWGNIQHRTARDWRCLITSIEMTLS